MTVTHGFLDHKIFQIISDTAASLGVRAFVIGGYVRDCFLGRPSKDIDIVVEGSGIELAEAVGAAVHSHVSVFRNFGTAMLKYRGIEVEFVGARKESYRKEKFNCRNRKETNQRCCLGRSNTCHSSKMQGPKKPSESNRLEERSASFASSWRCRPYG